LVRLAEKPGEAGDYARILAIERACPLCHGHRYDQSRVARYQFASKSFLDWLAMPICNAHDSLREVASGMKQQTQTVEATLGQCIRKLEALERGGLGHLALERATATLSGGELQRLKISRSLVGGLVNACFILDEPSLGLHAADNEAMIRNLRELRDSGNTVVLADHDPDFIAAADARIFLGPGAGHHGGRILTHDIPAPAPVRRAQSSNAGSLTLSGCCLHNVIDQTISVPIGRLVCLTGVSGSGKSTFARGILVPAVKAAINQGRRSGPAWADIRGWERVSALFPKKVINRVTAAGVRGVPSPRFPKNKL